MINVGFTGTQDLPHGSDHAVNYTARIRIWNAITELHPSMHKIIVGGCIGADALVALYAHNVGFQVHVVLPFGHAKVDPFWRQYKTTYEQMPVDTSYMQRNDRIVELADELIAFPKTKTEELRSGIWATIRRARKKHITITIIPLYGE